jgi:hypothetical protein
LILTFLELLYLHYEVYQFLFFACIRAFSNSDVALPNDRANSGIFLAPNIITTIINIINIHS